MPVIYEPKGAAREYSPYALNLYIGCSHRCQYCYAPHTVQRSAETYFGEPKARKNILTLLEKDLKENVYLKQILLSFIGDVYCENADHSQTTREALQLLNEYKAPVAVLSKGGERMLRDMDVWKSFGNRIAVGTSLTFYDADKSALWEAGAAPPAQRLAVIKEARGQGIQTFVSFEPVIEPEQTLKLIEKTLADDSVDAYKIGKLNHYKGLDKKVDWEAFLCRALELLRPARKKLYIKQSLRSACPRVPLFDEECDPERNIVRV